LAVELAKFYNRNNTDSASKYLSIGKKLTIESTNNNLKADLPLAEANYLQNLTKYSESVKVYEAAIALYEKMNNLKGLADAYNFSGVTYKKQGGDNQRVDAYSKKALLYENRALGYYSKINDAEGLMQVYSNFGIIYRDLHEYPKAEEAYLKGIKIAEDARIENHNLGKLKANLSQIYLDFYKNYDKAVSLL